MSLVARVDSVWRYPVKSMRGEELEEIFVRSSGAAGDRLFAFTSSAQPKTFPFFTAREQRHMLRYHPRLREFHPRVVPTHDASILPAEPLDPTQLSVEVHTPDGQALDINDPALIERLCRGVDDKHQVSLIRSEHALTDSHPLSIFSLQTVEQLARETGIAIDKQRFRANVYIDLIEAKGFAENAFVGCDLRIGSEVIVSVQTRDRRCVVITLDPDTAEAEPSVLKKVAQNHGGDAGLYGAVIVEGVVRRGDTVELVD